jgi:hypothetical protein
LTALSDKLRDFQRNHRFVAGVSVSLKKSACSLRQSATSPKQQPQRVLPTKEIDEVETLTKSINACLVEIEETPQTPDAERFSA